MLALEGEFIPGTRKPMLRPDQFHGYQVTANAHQLEFPRSMLWLGMGLGKTIVTLTTTMQRMAVGQITATLIIAPLRVVHGVWDKEARKWTHTKGLTFSKIVGTEKQRKRALFSKADIYLINYENLTWLTETLLHYFVSRDEPIPFQFIVYDEVSKMKNPLSVRMSGKRVDHEPEPTEEMGEFTLEDYVAQGWDTPSMINANLLTEPWTEVIKGWKEIATLFPYRTGLTGTPASNGYKDLFGQYLVIDDGQRLGTHKTHYQQNYFQPDHNGWNYTPTELGKRAIEQQIADITIQMAAEDYLDLKGAVYNNIMVELPAKARRVYKDLEKELFTILDSGTEVEVLNKVSVYNKCLQLCNGSMITDTETGAVEAIHKAKLEALDEVVEEAAGNPILCSYSYTEDAERIFKRYNKKNFKVVNMTKSKASDLPKIIRDWNSGKIQMIVGHPACLHPDTLVLTEWDGWIRIVDVEKHQRVFDGIEFVSHSGCSYSGYKDVIDVFGVTMTHNHKLLIDGEWREARDVGNHRDTKRKALYEYKGVHKYLGEMLPMRNGVRNTAQERNQAQPIETNTLPALCSGQAPHENGDTNLANLAGVEKPRQGHLRQGLRGSRDRSERGVGGLQKLLRRHARILQKPFNNRAYGREQGVLERELHLDNGVRSAVKQARHSMVDVSRGADSPCGIMSSNRTKQDEVKDAVESGDDSRSSGERCCRVPIWEEHETEGRSKAGLKKAHVYDLVDCGPRHRFLVRNSEGDVFISHNSMGHGVDELQEAGHILVWFGVPWSLEFYEQMNKRLDRQGNDNVTVIHRILCNDTIDIMVMDGLTRKDDTEKGLKDAMTRYRLGITTNDLELTFR